MQTTSRQHDLPDGPGIPPSGSTSAPSGPDRVLTDTEACDLDLLLAGVLPSGSLLGEADRAAGTQQDAGPAPRLAITVDDATRDRAVAAGALVLRDLEHTPVAVVHRLRPTGGAGTQVLTGDVRALRRRESGSLPSRRLDLTDPRVSARRVLLLARPPSAEEVDELAVWATTSPSGVLVLVPEGGADPAHVPVGTSWGLAQDLTAGWSGVDVEIRTVPLYLRHPAGDEQTAALLGRRLGPADFRMLTELSPEPGAGTWAEAAVGFLAGTASGPLSGIDPTTERRLRRWRPRRAERGLVVFLTGLSGSGKSTLARDLDDHLSLHTDRSVTLLDGDVVRRLLSSGLGFDRASRELNVRRIGWVGARIAEHGGTAICSPIAPFDHTRREVRRMVERVADLVLVHVSTPVEECERRDLKGLYARARRGEIPDFTGVSSPYEVPLDADVRVDTSDLTPTQALRRVLDHLAEGGWIGRGPA